MLKFITSLFAAKAKRTITDNAGSSETDAAPPNPCQGRAAAPPGIGCGAARAINALGLDLLARGTEAAANTVLSPYSIQSALAMAFAGSAGKTRAEMERVLHYSGGEAELHSSFAALRQAIERGGRGAAADNLSALTVANRLFGQMGFELNKPFLTLLKHAYEAPFEPKDFARHPSAAAEEINQWVAKQTRKRIRDLIPPGALDAMTRLVLVNAIYLKASWAEPFEGSATRPRPFHVQGGRKMDVPTMVGESDFGYARAPGFTVISLPYAFGDLHFLILLPNEVNGLAALEARVTPELLATYAKPEGTQAILYLPESRIEPPPFRQGQVLRSLGMESAFDQPRGSADFDRMAARKQDDYLFLSEVFHKTFLNLNERGTEAAAATGMIACAACVSPDRSEPVEVRVDRPFLFAIQHRPSGACLFLGRVTDPRPSRD
jgi:serpin B